MIPSDDSVGSSTPTEYMDPSTIRRVIGARTNCSINQEVLLVDRVGNVSARRLMANIDGKGFTTPNPDGFAPSSYSQGSGTSTTTLLPVVVGENPDSTSYLPIGAWVGIGLGVAAILIAAIYYFVGNKRIRETFVSMALRKSRKNPSKNKTADVEIGRLDPDLVYNECPEARWAKRSTITSTAPGNLSLQISPRILEIPFAPIDVDTDGRMSPRLPIASKQGSTPTAGTPSVTSRTQRDTD